MDSFKTKTNKFFQLDGRYCIAAILILPESNGRKTMIVAWENEDAAKCNFFAFTKTENIYTIDVSNVLKTCDYGDCISEKEAKKYFPHLF